MSTHQHTRWIFVCRSRRNMFWERVDLGSQSTPHSWCTCPPRPYVCCLAPLIIIWALVVAAALNTTSTCVSLPEENQKIVSPDETKYYQLLSAVTSLIHPFQQTRKPSYRAVGQTMALTLTVVDTATSLNWKKSRSHILSSAARRGSSSRSRGSATSTCPQTAPHRDSSPDSTGNTPYTLSW
jgi:hypothetical protein